MLAALSPKNETIRLYRSWAGVQECCTHTWKLEYNPATMAKRKAKKRTARRKASANATGKLPKDAVTLVVILRAKPGQESLLEAELRALIPPTRLEEGCLTYDLHRAVEPPDGFLLHEVWATREHHRRHMKTPHFLRWDARKDALLAGRDATFWSQLA
jgi:quinol monooxygenase YgiN